MRIGQTPRPPTSNSPPPPLRHPTRWYPKPHTTPRYTTITEPTADHTDEAIERERIRKLSTSSQGHLCPRCSKAALVRVRRPFYLRPLRRFGLDLRSYRCAMCGYGTIIRHRS